MSDINALIHIFITKKFLLVFAPLVSIGLFLPVRFLRPCRSVPFNVGLFAVIAVISSIGTFLKQEQADVMIYHTWWFAALVGLMAFDVLVCKLRKIPEPARKKETDVIRLASTVKRRALLKESFDSELSIEAIATKLTQRIRGFRLTGNIGNANEHVLSFDRFPIQAWGDFILHVSIVIILTGALIGVLFGFKEPLGIGEGETVQMKNRPYQVTLKKFSIDYYKSTGAPSLYASDIDVRQNGILVAAKQITVNHPLDINRVRFYQASWGMTNQLRSATIQVVGRALELIPDEIVPLIGTPFSIRLRQFLPTFDIDDKGQAITRDYEGKNPAVLIDFLQNDKVTVSVWILQNAPGVGYQANGPHLVETAQTPFSLLRVDPVLFSGIQVGYDPGAPVFWMGAIIFLLGLSIHFYFHARRINFVLTRSQKGTSIFIGGESSRSARDFEREFLMWAQEIKQELDV